MEEAVIYLCKSDRSIASLTVSGNLINEGVIFGWALHHDLYLYLVQLDPAGQTLSLSLDIHEESPRLAITVWPYSNLCFTDLFQENIYNET